jgi:hypothetical protein
MWRTAGVGWTNFGKILAQARGEHAAGQAAAGDLLAKKAHGNKPKGRGSTRCLAPRPSAFDHR